MVLREERRDLFTVDGSYFLAHCISQDFALGAGIAVQFNVRYDMATRLISKYAELYYDATRFTNKAIKRGLCIVIDNVFNLVTKRNFWQRGTYKALKEALEDMRSYIIAKNITKVAMPRIGCGLDRLQWDKVREILCDIFKDVNVEILVCYLF